MVTRTYRWDLLGQIDVLHEILRSLLEWTLQVYFFHIITQIGFLVYEADAAIFDLEVDFGAFLDIFGEGAISGDCETLTTKSQYVSFQPIK